MFFFDLQIALGQDQREKAVEALKSSSSNGDWLCLKNLHLCISWLPTLENVSFGAYELTVTGTLQNTYFHSYRRSSLSNLMKTFGFG